MRLYRVVNRTYADNFSGRGASFEDGARWNFSGTPVIYFGLSMATAMLEAAHYYGAPDLMPASYVKAIYELDDVDTESLTLDTLSDDWQSMPYPMSTQRIGDAFFTRSSSLLMTVPSVAVGIKELNMAIVNPLHPDINKLRLIETITPVYTDRLFNPTK